MENNTVKPYKGIYTDCTPNNQPEGTYRFALNGVIGTKEGDADVISNEASTKLAATITAGYTILNTIYIGNNEIAVFSVGATSSEIGVFNTDLNTYVVHVNCKLNFSIENQIDLTFRLRRGCERVVYFVESGNKPRLYNFDKPYYFKDASEVWDVDKFSLIKTYKSIPTISMTIGKYGQLKAGSYNFSIQGLDEDFNPTEFVNSTDTVIIYHDHADEKEFFEIRGSTNQVTKYQDFGLTTKSITLKIGSLDEDFLFYRVAIISATSGTGFVDEVLYSNPISVKNTTFVYTGVEGVVKGTVEEISAFRPDISSANHILQIENELLLANTKGTQINYCELQEYASKIETNCVLKEIDLNHIDGVSNPKNGLCHINDMGYMPGEMYSFGIVYIFDDYSTTPVYHIPGSSPTATTTMSKDNKISTKYIDNSMSCAVAATSYWGNDSEGDPLVDEYVRHHRFPLRRDFTPKQSLIETSFDSEILYFQIGVIITGQWMPNLDAVTNELIDDEITISIVYTVSTDAIAHHITLATLKRPRTKEYVYYTYQTLYETLPEEITGITSMTVTATSGFASPNIPTFTHAFKMDSNTFSNLEHTSNILGVQFSNIDVPVFTGSDKQIVGYYIVRNEREEINKSVLDTCVLTPLVNDPDGKYTAFGFLAPQIDAGTNTPPDFDGRISNQLFGLIHPEFLFNGKDYSNATSLEKQGDFNVRTGIGRSSMGLWTEDVQPGTSYDPDIHKRRERDSDGFGFYNIIRTTYLTYDNTSIVPNINAEALKKIFYLNALHSKEVIIDNAGTDEVRLVYNISGDNKIGIVQLNESYLDITGAASAMDLEKFPLYTMKRELTNQYSNFRTLPYYKEHSNLETLVSTSSVTLYNGDTYISSLKMASSVFYGLSLRTRASKSGIFRVVLGTLAIIGGAVASIAAGSGLALVAAGLAIVSSGIRIEMMVKAYEEEYDKGLINTISDNFTDANAFASTSSSAPDDVIQWVHDTFSNLWFESTVNMNWRTGTTRGFTDFLDPDATYMSESLKNYFLNKMTNVDLANQDGRVYQGYAKAEVYLENKDFKRRDREKVFFHLGLEYDCCSECVETFKHRVWKSETSFQEENTDNFRIFLPNNYIDIEGETGEITNMFKIQNNIYVHTEENLWHLPSRIQERITGDVVSFIGSGDFFSMSPKSILDSKTGNSAGTINKWGTVQTPYGVFFIAEKQGVVYKFDGNKLENVSAKGMEKWFKENIPSLCETTYSALNSGAIYPYLNNPSNPIGLGFCSVYDSENERILITKKDYNYRTENIEAPAVALYKNSWTLSYSLKHGFWTSFHSYIPNHYFNNGTKLFSCNSGDSKIWQHSIKGDYGTIYGIKKKFIVELIISSKDTELYDSISYFTEAFTYVESKDSFIENRLTTFKSVLFYNDRQISGLLTIVPKDANIDTDYISDQVKNVSGETIADKNEQLWTINNFKDYRDDYDKPLFDKSNANLQDEYFIDKKINADIINYNKDWTQVENFRGKYLAVRFIFDNFDDIKLMFDYINFYKYKSDR